MKSSKLLRCCLTLYPPKLPKCLSFCCWAWAVPLGHGPLAAGLWQLPELKPAVHGGSGGQSWHTPILAPRATANSRLQLQQPLATWQLPELKPAAMWRLWGAHFGGLATFYLHICIFIKYYPSAQNLWMDLLFLGIKKVGNHWPKAIMSPNCSLQTRHFLPRLPVVLDPIDLPWGHLTQRQRGATRSGFFWGVKGRSKNTP